jgi:hypothetical protein
MLVAPDVPAADVWVLRGSTGPCEGLQWEADTLLFNTALTPATVRLLEVSDGSDEVTTRQLEIAPRQVASLRNLAGDWRPSSEAALWMLHLDVSESVTVEGVLNIGTGTGLCVLVPTPDRSALYGTTRLPVFRTLAASGTEQVHLGTSLGLLAARNNVGIFNAGDVAASATIEVRRGCDDRLLAATTVQVAANSTVQIRLDPKSDSGCMAGHRDVQPWVETVRVVVDQPSLTWVSSLANGVAPRGILGVR